MGPSQKSAATVMVIDHPPRLAWRSIKSQRCPMPALTVGRNRYLKMPLIVARPGTFVMTNTVIISKGLGPVHIRYLEAAWYFCCCWT